MITPLHEWPELRRARKVVPSVVQCALKEARINIQAIYYAPMGGADAAKSANDAAWDALKEMADSDPDGSAFLYHTCVMLRKRMQAVGSDMTVEAALVVLTTGDNIAQCVAVLHALNMYRVKHDQPYVTVTTFLEAFVSGPPAFGEVERFIKQFPNMAVFDDMSNESIWPRGAAQAELRRTQSTV